MIDHLSIPVNDLEKCKTFYTAALKPLNYIPVIETPEAACFGHPDGTSVWLVQGQSANLHFAFRGEKEQIHAFYEAALAAGGTDNGAPGPRPHYEPDYYAAFVHDPEGNNVEAMGHVAPE